MQIQLCGIECCLMHPINHPRCWENVKFTRDLDGWNRICDNIYIVGYNTNFENYLLPFPNLRAIEPSIRYYVLNNARGIFMLGAHSTSGAELSDLRNYITSNLLWDPTRSGRKLMDEFLDLHYGRAAQPIRRFINLVHDNVQTKGLHQGCYGRAADYGVDESIARAGLEAFVEAIKLAESDAVRSRVEKASICAVRAAIEPVWYLEDGADLPPHLDERMRPLVKHFLELCDRHAVTHVAEGRTVDGARDRLKRVFGKFSNRDQ